MANLIIEAAWDGDAGVWFVQKSDIPGLNVEAGTLDEFEAIVADVAPDLISSNLPDIGSHFSITLNTSRQIAAA